MPPAALWPKRKTAIGIGFDCEQKVTTGLEAPKRSGKCGRQIAKVNERVGGKDQIVVCTAGRQRCFDVSHGEVMVQAPRSRLIDHLRAEIDPVEGRSDVAKC